MKAIVSNARYFNGTTKSGNPMCGYFMDFFLYDGRDKCFKQKQGKFIDIKKLEGYQPEVGAILDIETEYGKETIISVTPVVDDPTFLAQFLAPFQAALQAMKKQ